MTDLIAARSQMAMSLAFHIIFASIAMAMPWFMAAAEWRWLRYGDEVALLLAKRWAKGTAILFAVGAVSGTVLAFELGLLWPSFMQWAGGIIGLLFGLEGFAFFTEAIFLGIYLYGWQRVSPRAHFAAALVIGTSGVVSAVFVIMANGWMNTPTGFELAGGRPIKIDPIAAMLNPSGLMESLHMILAAFAATGFAVAGIHAFLLLRDPPNPFHQHALRIVVFIGGVAALLQIVSGDVLTRRLAIHEPVKLAAVEAVFHTQRGAPLHLGGIPDVAKETTKYSIDIPRGVSLLVYHDADAVVKGLDAVPRKDWPPVAIVHIAFQLMVGAGLVMSAVAAWAAWQAWRGRFLRDRWLLRALVCTAPLGFFAIECGWVTTEVGRQPWIISGVMRTADAVTPMPGLIVPFTLFTCLYVLLAIVVLWLLIRHVAASPETPAHSADREPTDARAVS